MPTKERIDFADIGEGIQDINGSSISIPECDFRNLRLELLGSSVRRTDGVVGEVDMEVMVTMIVDSITHRVGSPNRESPGESHQNILSMAGSNGDGGWSGKPCHKISNDPPSRMEISSPKGQ